MEVVNKGADAEKLWALREERGKVHWVEMAELSLGVARSAKVWLCLVSASL